MLIGRGEKKGAAERVVVFERVENPRNLLARLFEWATGAKRAPLPFFPRASRDFAAQWAKGKTDEAWRDAEQTYRGGNTGGPRMPESEEGLEHALLWEGASPVDRGRALSLPFHFDEVAEAFFGPLLAAREVYRK